MARVQLSLLLLALLAHNAHSFFSWPTMQKPRCSFRPVQLKLKSDNVNRFRGSCSVTGWRQDTCKGSRLACCRNVVGEFLCVRPEGVEKRRQDLFYRIANPFEMDTPKLLDFFDDEEAVPDQSDSVCPKPTSAFNCIYDQSTGPCKSQEDCPDGSACCDDPCYQGGPHLKLCYVTPQAGLAAPGNAPVRPVESELPGELDAGELKKPQEPVDEVITGPKNAIVIPPKDKDIGKPETTQKIETPSKEGPPADDLRAPPVPAELKDDEPVATHDGQCPVAKKVCDDEGKCAVACPGYSKDVTTCKVNEDCAENRVCCDDPCPGSELRLCFLKKKNGGIAASANAKVSPPKELKEKKKPPKGKKKMVNDDPKERFKCPAADLDTCVGWAPVPGQEKGTGLCKDDSPCIKGRKCCKISGCNDGIKYCVPWFDTKERQPGCPIPQHLAVNKAKKCEDGCNKSEICCLVDMQGTKACVTPVKPNKSANAV